MSGTDNSADRFTFQDTVFIYLEKQDMPMHIGVVALFDGPIPTKGLQRSIESKLGDIPRYMQKVEMPTMYLTHPRWVPDDQFDIRHHVRRVRLPHGSMSELQDLVSQSFSENMDRNRPLWDVTVVDGFEGGQTPVIWRVHHCLVDGIAGVELMKVMLDDSPTAPRRKAKKKPDVAREPQPAELSLAEHLLESYAEFAQGFLSIPSAALEFLQSLAAGPLPDSLDKWSNLLPDLLKPVQRMSFNVQCAGPRRFAWTQLPMAEIDAIRKTVCGTVNDVIVTVLTSALRRYTEYHGGEVNRLLRIMAPVNTRRPDNTADMGVNISLIPIDVPLGTTNSTELLAAIHSRTKALKGARMSGVFSIASACLSGLPVPLQIATSWVLTNPLPMAPWNLICTNVPGPTEPLYLLGRKMLDCYPYLPIIPMGNEMGLSVAVYSYCGNMYVGLAGDLAALPDVDRLREFFDVSYADLRNTVVGRPKRTPGSRPARKRKNVKVEEPAPAVKSSEPPVSSEQQAPTAAAAVG